METNYPILLSPFTVRNVTFKNRMLMAPMGYCVDNSDGVMHYDNLDYYAKLASTGIARVTTGDCPVNCIDAGYGGGKMHLALYDNPNLMMVKGSITKYVQALHRHNAAAFVELMHEGQSAFRPQNIDGSMSSLSPGSVPFDINNLDEKDIDRLCNDFATCVKHCREFGLDGVIIHGGHGKLLDQFRSKAFNHRTDKYGGSLINRCRFPIKLLEKVRDAAGDNFVIEYRFSADEGGFENAITIEETVEYLKILEDEKLVDIFHCSGGIHFWPQYNIRSISPAYYPAAYNLHAAERIKDAGIKTPLALVNSLTDPELEEKILREGKADLICMARQLNVADPYFPKKVAEGREEYINNCIRCHECCDGSDCAVNPITARKMAHGLYYTLPKAEECKNVVIVGGGITGLKASETAAFRGHQVTIIEKNNRLGGLLRFSDTDTYKFDIKRFKNNMIKRLENADNVNVILNTKATPKIVEKLKPDAVIVAIGGIQKVPDIPGVTGKNVMTIMDVYDCPERVGDSVLFIGNGLTACEVAMHLGKLGKKVTIMGRREHLAFNENVHQSFFDPIPGIIEEYSKYRYPVRIINNCNCIEITKDGAKGLYKNGNEVFVVADTVVIAAGMDPLTNEAYSYYGTAPYVRIAGDCRKPSKIKHAVSAGYYAAMDI